MKKRANRLLELRKESGKSQSVVGDFLGISQSRMSDYENGENIPSDILRAFAEYYGVSADYILCTTDDRNGKVSGSISEKENVILRCYRNLSPELKRLFDRIVTAFWVC